MPVQTSPPPAIPPVDLIEGPHGDLYLRRGRVAHPVDPDWPQKLADHTSPFRHDAEPWLTNPGYAPDNNAARALAATLTQNGYRRIATLHIGGRVETLQAPLQAATLTYLGNTRPPEATTPRPIPAVNGRPATPRYDAVPADINPEPEIDVRIAPNLVLGLHRHKTDPDRWYLIGCDLEGNLVARGASGVTRTVPDAVWQMAAEAVIRAHHAQRPKPKPGAFGAPKHRDG